MRLKNIPGARETVESSPYVEQNPDALRGRWREAFGIENAPLHIEVGMGKGQFLITMAMQHPDICYAGFEMYDSVLLRAVQKKQELEESGNPLPNLKLVRMDARLLPDVFAPEEVDRIYLNFSDPWPKARHDKRRLTSRVFLECYSRILKPGGLVEFKTDNQALFDFSLEEAAEAGWPLEGCTRDLHQDPEMSRGNVMTEYEEKFRSQGHPICKMIIRYAPEGTGEEKHE